jgi:hypothetical protein
MRRLLYTLTTLLAVCASALVASSAQVSTTTARALLFKLTVQAESGSGSYSRSYFRHWIDADGDGCDTRQEVLIAESKVTVRPGAGCRVTTGRWYSWYDGATWTNAADVDIDHLVALKEAWESGARSWSATNRTRYANDLGHGWSLDAVTDNVNASKGDRDPAQWLPPRSSARCAYAIHWVAMKYRWRLSIDSAERSRLYSILSGTCGAKTVTIPRRAI